MMVSSCLLHLRKEEEIEKKRYKVKNDETDEDKYRER